MSYPDAFVLAQVKSVLLTAHWRRKYLGSWNILFTTGAFSTFIPLHCSLRGLSCYELVTPSLHSHTLWKESIPGAGKMVQHLKTHTGKAWWPEFHHWNPLWKETTTNFCRVSSDFHTGAVACMQTHRQTNTERKIHTCVCMITINF